MTDTDQPMPDAIQRGHELSMAVVSLLKGPVFRDRKPELWHTTTGALQPRVRDHVAVLGLDLVIDEAEGYAFLRSVPADGDDEAASTIPRLVPRRPLSFEVSLLLALLRRRLAELDGNEGGADRLILTTDDIVEMIRLFLPDTTNETRLLGRIDSHITKATELGFLRRLDKRAAPGRPVRYEVQRIIKAFIDGQWLAEFDRRLADYRRRLRSEDPAASGPPIDGDDDE
ncbi:MAG: DUF4194 domain-containing protein [Acidimicrobiales bacterium]